MQALQRQNELFKNYISSLEKENDARNIERTTLFNQIDRMTLQIERLNALLSKSSSRVVVNTANSSQKELKILSDTNTAMKKEIESLKIKINQYVLDISNRDKQISTLTSQKQGYLLEIKTLKDSQVQSSSSNNRIILLENQINSYKIKISQISTLEQSLRISNSRIIELQNINKRLEIDFKRIQADFKRQQVQYKRLETQSRQLKFNSKPSSQASTLLSAKLNLEATVRQLNSKIEWLQTSIKTTQQQKSSFQKRSRQLQRQLLEAKGKLTQYRFNDDNIKSLQNNLAVKEKQMEALEQMINSLKENKKYLEKSLKEKEEIITKIESQVYLLKTSKSEDQHLQRELYQLREGKKMFQQQMEGYIHINRELQAQMMKFQHEQHAHLSEISNLRTQRQRILQQLDQKSSSLDQAHKQIQSFRSRSPQQPKVRIQSDAYYKHIPQRQQQRQDDLRMMVSTLKQQVQILKASQFKSRITTQTNNKWQPINQNNSNLKQYLVKNTKSPQKISHSKLLVGGHDREKRSANNQVWQNLQRKIQLLRSENQTLKKSLFD